MRERARVSARSLARSYVRSIDCSAPPPDLREAVCTLIFAAPRCSIKELTEVGSHAMSSRAVNLLVPAILMSMSMLLLLLLLRFEASSSQSTASCSSKTP